MNFYKYMVFTPTYISGVPVRPGWCGTEYKVPRIRRDASNVGRVLKHRDINPTKAD